MACANMEDTSFDKCGRSSEISGVKIDLAGDAIGKGLFATKTYKEGDVIFEERPLVSCQFPWNAAYGYSACEFCMRPLETAEENAKRLSQDPHLTLPYPQNADPKINPVKCPFCYVLYCSEECRLVAHEQYHQTLCLRSFTRETNHPLVMLEEAWKHMHYPPETSSIILLCRILASIRQSSDRERSVNLLKQFCHRSFNEDEEIVHKMLGKEFQAQLDVLRQLMSAYFGGKDVDEWLSADGFVSLIALVGTNGQGIGTSSLSQWVQKCEQVEETLSEEAQVQLDRFVDDVYDKIETVCGTFLNNEGSGLYILQSSCNHDCSPNARATFPKNDFTLVMVTLEDIEKGDEIKISYLDDCSLDRSRHSRAKILRENYLFNCKCSKCLSEADDEDVTSEEEMDDNQDCCA